MKNLYGFTLRTKEQKTAVGNVVSSTGALAKILLQERYPDYYRLNLRLIYSTGDIPKGVYQITLIEN
jgi:hypothetical protein